MNEIGGMQLILKRKIDGFRNNFAYYLLYNKIVGKDNFAFQKFWKVKAMFSAQCLESDTK